MDKSFASAVSSLPDAIRRLLCSLPDEQQLVISEIRLRSQQPLCVTLGGDNLFITRLGQAQKTADNAYICTREDIFNGFRRLCEYSVYTYQHQINRGFITQAGGHRAGVYGSAVVDGASISNIRDISGFNIRVAREFIGCCAEIVRYMSCRKTGSIVIAGMPSSGKTTLLRDLIRHLSERRIRVCAVDERSEICSVSDGVSPYSLGHMCDCLNGYPKADGAMIAVRCLAPQTLVFDEIGTRAELEAARECFCAGVNVITSVHAGGLEDFFKRDLCRELLFCEGFDYFVFLSGKPGVIEKIYERGELLELFRNRADCGSAGYLRNA